MPPLALPASHVHLVGIGGAGMSALARLYLATGATVSGSDASDSKALRDLQALGTTVAIGHDATHVASCLGSARPLVVASSAIPPSNPELVAARAAGVTVLKHADALATFVNARRGIAVAGTHGKTTTTAMVTLALQAGGLDPSFQVGGELVDLDTSAGMGTGDWMVVEADEYDRRFLAFAPEVAVVTNVEPEHFEYYGSVAEMEGAYSAFLDRVVGGGVVIAASGAGPDRGARLDRILATAGLASRGIGLVRYGMSASTADDAWRVADFRPDGAGAAFLVVPPDGAAVPMHLKIPGAHNAMNAIAACAVAAHAGVPLHVSIAALERFHGVRRRFQVIHDDRGILVVEDYAHHPTEVRATLAAARPSVAGGRLWAVFQPHLHVRTERLFDDFVDALATADRVILADTYSPPGREPDGAYRGAPELVDALRAAHSGVRADHVRSEGDLVDAVFNHAAPGDVVVVMGAGPIDRSGREIARRLTATAASGPA